MKRTVTFGGIFLIGIVCGAWVAQHPHPASAPTTPSAASPPAVALPSVNPALKGGVKGELWLADFESDQELTKQWKRRDVVATRAEEHATHGRSAAKITFSPSEVAT